MVRCVFIGLITATLLNAQTADIPDALLPLDSDNAIVRQQEFLQFISGKSAAAYGFSSISEQIFRNLLEQEQELEPEIEEETRYQLVLNLLNQDKKEEAREFLQGFADTSSDRYKFAALLLAYVDNAETSELETRLASLAGADLGNDQVWINVMRGIVLTRSGLVEDARRVFDEALDQAINAFQRNWIETLIWREEILNGRADEALLFSLKSQIDNSVNPLIESQLTQQYAIALNLMGRTGEAISVIERQLPGLGGEYRDQRDRMLMLLAILAGRESGKAEVAIEDILLRGRSERMRSMAFYFWLSGADFSDQGQVEILEQLFESNPQDPLRNEIAYALALSSFYRGNLNQSQARIDSILESDAEVELKRSALRVLVAVCWSQEPPQYRLAAEHLLRLRRLSSDTLEKNRYSMLIADSYYLNGDYENAYPYYNGLMDEPLPPGVKNELLFKTTDALLKLGNLDGARPILDRFHNENPELSELIWGSEWNFNLYLVGIGRLDEAIVRMEQLESANNREPVEVSPTWRNLARLRVAWLLGFLNFQKQDFDAALGVVSRGIESYGSFSDEDQVAMAPVVDELKLLSVRCYFELQEQATALRLISEIRENGSSDTAAASYIIEARYYLSISDEIEAQRALMELADQYPESDFAPVALYEAAISVESRVDETSDQEAIALYERISSQFPDHPLNFVSRLKQGDLLRKSNQFALAISFYENMQSDYLGDPRLYLVDMALAESYLAMGSTRLDYIDQAVQILERVFELASLPVEVRIEAGTKAAIGLDKVGRNFRAQDQLWRVIRLVNREPGIGVSIGSTGKYWMARATLILSDMLIANGEPGEVRRLIEIAEAMNLPGLNLLRGKL